MSRRAKGTGGLYKNKQGYWVGQIIIGTTPEGKTKYKRFMNKSQAVVIEKMKAYELQHPIIASVNTTILLQDQAPNRLT